MISELSTLVNRWGTRAGLSIADQGLVSGANFVLSILLARWLHPAEYGSFAIAFSVFLFLAGFHNALVLEPMSVLGPNRHMANLSKYLGSLVWIHMGLTISLTSTLVIVSMVLKKTGFPVAGALLGISIAMPFVLLFWLFRRVCYLNTRPDLALKGGVCYALLLFLSILIIQTSNVLSPLSAFSAMAFTSLVTSICFFSFLGLKTREFSWKATRPEIRAVLSEHWAYGKWVMGSAFTQGLGNALHMSIIGALAGLAQAGAYQALWNLARPLQQTLTALGVLLLPWVSRQQAEHGRAYIKRALPKVAGVNLFLTVCYSAILILFGGIAMEFIYDQSFYGYCIWLLPYVVVVLCIGAVRQGINIALKALEHPDIVFWAHASSALLLSTIGIYLIWKWKLLGAMLSLIFSTLLGTSIVYYALRNHLRCS